MRQIYTAPTVPAAESYFDDFAQQWEPIYPAMISSWRNAWEEFVPFLAFPVELRKVVYTTNAIESLNSRFRRAVRQRGHFSNETAALKVLYLVATARVKNRENMTGQINGWKGILNTLSRTGFSRGSELTDRRVPGRVDDGSGCSRTRRAGWCRSRRAAVGS